MSYVITCGDEGVQINTGTRLAMVGAGIKVENFDHVLDAWKKLFGQEICIASSAENDWVKQQFGLNTFEQADATMQQYAAALADTNKLLYTGFLPFADPKDLDHGIRGHMVRPQGMHLANKICFTLAGGEQVYNLGQYLISVEWAHLVDKKIAKQVIQTQVDYYNRLAGQPLQTITQEDGELGAEIAAQNKAILVELGFLS